MSRSLSSASLSTGKKVRLQRKFYEKLDDFTGRVLLHSESGYVVYRAKCRYSHGIVVLKGYGRDMLTKPNKLHIMKEVEILQQNECPFLLRCFDCFEDQGWWWLVLENCAGGDLYGITQNHPEATSNDGWVASQVVLPMLQTLAYLHEEGIMHRDIKPEHIMFNSEKVAKLGGFFLCHDVAEQGFPRDMVGEVQYSAPEMAITADPSVKGGRYCYDHKVDIWSLGVLIYECLVGHLPFHHDDPAVMSDMILNFDPDFPPYLTEDARDFLVLMLQKDAEDRPEASALLDHPWIKTNLDWVPDVDFEDPVVLSSFYSMEDSDDAHRRCWGLGAKLGSIMAWFQGGSSPGQDSGSGSMISWLSGWMNRKSADSQSKVPNHDRFQPEQINDNGEGLHSNNTADAVLLAKSSFKRSFERLPSREITRQLYQQDGELITTMAYEDSNDSAHRTSRQNFSSEHLESQCDHVLSIQHSHSILRDSLQASPHYDSSRHQHPMQPQLSHEEIPAELELTPPPASRQGSRVPTEQIFSPGSQQATLMAAANAPLSEIAPVRRSASSMLSSQWQRAPVEPLALLMQNSRPAHLTPIQAPSGQQPPLEGQQVFPDPMMPYPAHLEPCPCLSTLEH